MMTQILQFTNAEGMRRASFKQPPITNWKSVTKEKLDAVLGLLYLCDLLGMSKVSVRRIWAKLPVQNPIFPAVIFGEKFAKIFSLLRFDDRDTRATRRAVDKFARIRELWNCGIRL